MVDGKTNDGKQLPRGGATGGGWIGGFLD